MRFLFPLLLILAGGEGASALPRCAPPLEGAVACLDGKLCECRHHPGGSIAGRPPAVRWDCGALRPPCGAAALPRRRASPTTLAHVARAIAARLVALTADGVRAAVLFRTVA